MNRFLLLTVISLSLIKTTQCMHSNRRPVPNADVLEEILSKYLGDSYSNNALSDYILGKPSKRDSNLAGENLDISILDVDTVKKVINFAKKRYMDGLTTLNTRRKYHIMTGDQRYPFTRNFYMINQTINLMQQTVYFTKDKVNRTRPFRAKYHKDTSFQIAVLYGASAALLGKMENLLAQMYHFPLRTHLLWHLLCYEKILACNVDIGYAVERIFLLNAEYIKKRGEKKELMEDIEKMGQNTPLKTPAPPGQELYVGPQEDTRRRQGQGALTGQY